MVQAQTDDGRQGVLPSQLFDTRSLSMANSTIADVYGRPSIGVNAALSGLSNAPVFVQFNSNHNWGNNLMQHDLTLPTLSTGPHHITTRFSVIHQGLDDLPFTSTSSLPEPDITMYRADLAYAFAIGPHFSLGALQSVSYTTNNENDQYWNYFADVGLVYAPDGPVSYGLVFRGLGHEVEYEILETGQTLLNRRFARQTLEIGVTFRYPIDKRTFMSVSFANEKRFSEEGLWYKGGVEISPASYVHFRGGILANFDQSRFIPRAGLGINAGIIQLDYMIAPQNQIGEEFHQVGLTISF
ncbi:MAG: hypothetical protein ACNA8K_15005 [Cyclonatronaceae bacterium]